MFLKNKMIYQLIMATLIPTLITYGSNPSKKVEEITNQSTFINLIRKYSDTVKFDKRINLYVQFEKQRNFSLTTFDTEEFKDNIEFQKSVIKIVLKIYLYCISDRQPRDELKYLYYATKTTEKIIDEYIYIMNSKKVPITEIENLEVSTVIPLIQKNKKFKNDKDIMRLSHICILKLKTMNLDN